MSEGVENQWFPLTKPVAVNTVLPQCRYRAASDVQCLYKYTQHCNLKAELITVYYKNIIIVIINSRFTCIRVCVMFLIIRKNHRRIV